MRFPTIRRCPGEGDGKKELAPPFRNPFVHDLRFTPLEKAKIALMTVTLFPIRLFLAAFMMLLAWPFAFIASVGRDDMVVEPQSLWRKFVDVALRTIMRVMWFAGGFHWMTVKGRQALPAEAPILTLGPHSSYFDAIPVTMTMSSIVMKAESKDIPVWGSCRFKILWLTLCQLHNEFIIEFLPVYTPSEEERNNPALFAHNVRRLMAKALDIPITDYSFEDCQLAMAEGQLRLPVDTCLLEFAKLVRRLGLKPQNVEKVLQEFGNRARKMEGEKLGLEDFAHYLDVPVSDMLRDIFSLFNEQADNMIDIREYVIALSVVCRPAKTLETMKLAFKMFEAEEDGAVTGAELACILKTALGVAVLDVSRLFTAIDTEDAGKLTFDKFRSFAEQHPNFSEDYLSTDNTDRNGCPHQPNATPNSKPQTNGFCPDFSPRDNHHDTTTDGSVKKHN
ncbi:lysophosphatidylcholine acyltransferase 1-like [Salvelinus namaycush]|uniref:Lysophosphatidylcholine acyltransferase 1-like n=1 Tax=Salvelinus namaycush TaxID=8040 RepID=A0A8U0QG22_SALNM|nr:lysophosphatidylcholine acyltransferase 1-like [Salvelinus namaycush]